MFSSRLILAVAIFMPWSLIICEENIYGIIRNESSSDELFQSAIDRLMVFKNHYFHKRYDEDFENDLELLKAENLRTNKSKPDKNNTMRKIDLSSYAYAVEINPRWQDVARFLTGIGLSTVGITSNGFFLSAFFVENSLRNTGNTFLATVGLANMVVSALIPPISTVSVLANVDNKLPLCKLEWNIAQASLYVMFIAHSLVSIETFKRLSGRRSNHPGMKPFWCLLSIIGIWAVAFTVSSVGVYHGLDYNHCTRVDFGNTVFRGVTFVFFYVIPTIIIVIFYTKIIVMARKFRHIPYYKRAHGFRSDFNLSLVNLFHFVTVFVTWVIYGCFVFIIDNASNKTVYGLAWMGVFNFVASNMSYIILNADFRRAYATIFQYCCCKATVPLAQRNRNVLSGTAENARHPVSDIKVHIMHQSLSSPMRATRDSPATTEM